MPPPKKKTAPAPVPTKASFFAVKREFEEPVAVAAPVAPRFKPVEQRPVYEKPPRLLYDKGTGMPYAEIVDDSAICLDSGVELFRFRNRDDDEDYEDNSVVFAPTDKRLDFTPPAGKRHPNDHWVDVAGLVELGILSDEDVMNRKGFSSEQLQEMMQLLSAHRAMHA